MGACKVLVMKMENIAREHLIACGLKNIYCRTLCGPAQVPGPRGVHQLRRPLRRWLLMNTLATFKAFPLSTSSSRI